MAIPQFTMRQLLEAGVHYGHHTRRWNPKMRQYIFGVRNGVHILDLQQTTPMLAEALQAMRDIVAKGGRVLFVGTKRQASDRIAEAAKQCGQYYVNNRWLGGMLTNWQTISKSIARLRELDGILGDQEQIAKRTKKEILMLTRERDKLETSIGGIKDMGGQPDAMFVIDTKKEDLAIAEAKKLGIPVFGIVDSNANFDGVDYVIPGNDDALRAIDLYCELFVGSILDGLQEELATTAADPGEAEEVNVNLPPKVVEEEKEELTPGEQAKLDAEAKADKADEKKPKADEKAANAEPSSDEKKAANA